MKVELRVVAPDGHPQGDAFTMSDGGRLIVVYAPPGATNRQACAIELAKVLGPDDCCVVLPHGYRIEVLQPVEVP